MFLDEFGCGVFEFRSPSGRGILIEDSEIFGPSKINPRTGSLSEVPVSHPLNWFWDVYPKWRETGRPSKPFINMPIGPTRLVEVVKTEFGYALKP